MNRFLFFILFQFILVALTSAQVISDSSKIQNKNTIIHSDSSTKKDTLLSLPITDSVSKRPHKNSGWHLNSDFIFSFRNYNNQVLEHHLYYGFGAAPLDIYSKKVKSNGKESLFYAMILLLLVFGFLKKIFPRYFNDLFRLFFRTTLKQRQIKEQLIQTPLPSLLFNGFFIITAALYIDFILQHFKLIPNDNFWLFFIYCIIGLSAIYFVKFLGLKLSGWVFNRQEATNSYIYIVFVVNKMIGICLLPLVVLLAFTGGEFYSTILIISWCCVGALFIYRIVLSFYAVRNLVKVNLFHFILYLVAFEVVPLLLIYKVLLFVI